MYFAPCENDQFSQGAFFVIGILSEKRKSNEHLGYSYAFPKYDGIQ